MSGLYEGCWHKLSWAKKHVDTLKRDIQTRDLDVHPPYGLRTEFRPDLDCMLVFFANVETPPTEWSLMIGDALTNFRAALDYCAHDLVSRGSEPHIGGTAKPQFVICREGKDFKGLVNGRMPGIRAAHKAIVEDYQPYRWLDVKELHPFFLLDELVRRDKHRQIEPVFTQHTGNLRITVPPKDSRDFIVTGVEKGFFFRSFPTPTHIEPGAEAARVFGRATGPKPQVAVTFDSTTTIAFENGVGVGIALDRIGAKIAELFSELEPVL